MGLMGRSLFLVELTRWLEPPAPPCDDMLEIRKVVIVVVIGDQKCLSVSVSVFVSGSCVW